MRRLLVPTLFLILATFPYGLQAKNACDLVPLTLPLFDATPVEELAMATASPIQVDLTESEARRVLETFVACTNTGDPALVWAMFTPHWFSEQFADSQEHYLPALEYQIATGSYPATEPLSLDSIATIKELKDGRYAVTATFSSGNLKWTDQLILIYLDGQWLIDDVVPVSPPD